MTGSLFIITAASGTGKTSLVKQLLATTNDLTVSVSHTTRAPRPGEIDGQHYHFTDVDKFVTAIGEGKFLEHAEVFGNYYGTSEQSVRAQLEAGVDDGGREADQHAFQQVGADDDPHRDDHQGH